MIVATLFALLPLVAGHEPLLPAPAAAALPQGAVLEEHPRYFISAGWLTAEGEVKGPVGADPKNETGLSLAVGIVSWREDFGLALEGGLITSSYDLRVDALTEEDVDATRYLLGVRMIDANWENLLWHGRVGAMFRQDEGTRIDDDGFGWYAGGGVEWQLGPLSVGPQFLYAESESVNSAEWIFGINGTLGF